MKVKTRIIISVVTVWVVAMVFFLAADTGVFINKQTNGIYDYRTITVSDMKKKLPVQGQCYVVIDCVGSYISEKTYYFTNAKEQHTSSYYYIIPFDETQFMLLKTSANSDLTTQADQMVDAFWNEDSPYLNKLDEGIYLDGILKENDPEIVSFFYNWCEDVDIKDMKLVPYTLDCTKSVSTCINEFWVGVVLLILFLAACGFAVFKLFVGKNRQYSSYSNSNNPQSGQFIPTASFSSSPANSSPQTPNGSGTSNSYNSLSKYDPTNTYQSGSYGTSYGGFQSQGGQSNANSYNSQSKYDPTNTYQSGSYGTSYGGFQSQGGQSNANSYNSQSKYDPTNTYQSGSYGSSYGGFQGQSGQSNANIYNSQSKYDPTNTYQSGSYGSSYGGVQSQGGQNDADI